MFEVLAKFNKLILHATRSENIKLSKYLLKYFLRFPDSDKRMLPEPLNVIAVIGKVFKKLGTLLLKLTKLIWR